MTDHEAAIDELLRLLDLQYPEEVDVFEDRLAERLGVHRFAHLDYDEWRRVRVQAIDAAGEASDDPARWVEGTP